VAEVRAFLHEDEKVEPSEITGGPADASRGKVDTGFFKGFSYGAAGRARRSKGDWFRIDVGKFVGRERFGGGTEAAENWDARSGLEGAGVRAIGGSAILEGPI